MMTEKYAAYIQMLATRDQALSSLGALAVGVVLTWELIRWIPEPWRTRVRPAYLVGGILLYVATLIVVALIGGSNG